MLVKYVGRKKIVSHDYARKRFSFHSGNNYICDIPLNLFREIMRSFSNDYIPAMEHVIDNAPPTTVDEHSKPVEVKKTYKCFSCGEAFNTSEEVKRHYAALHGKKKK